MAHPDSATRSESTARRSSRRPIEYGEALRFTTSCAPARPWSATGPPGNQTSSQTVMATGTPAITYSTYGSVPGANQRSSSKTL